MRCNKDLERGAPDGNRTHVSQIALGVLSQLNYEAVLRTAETIRGCSHAGHVCTHADNFRWASGAADTGLRKRDSNPRHQTFIRRLSHGEQPPLWLGAITCELRPIEIGVTNRIRTGTNAFTGRDAACYIMITIEMEPRVGLAPTNTGLRNPPCSC